MRDYWPMLVVLLEPKISGHVADEICKKIGNNCWDLSEAEGFSGGVWLLWNEVGVKVSIRYVHNFFIHIAVTSLGCKSWKLTTVYASPNASRRRILLQKLDDMMIEGPSILLGDF